MNETDLKRIFDDQHISPKAYSLDGTRQEECLVLYQSNGIVSVGWWESGRMWPRVEFEEKSDALEYLGWNLFAHSKQFKRGHEPLSRKFRREFTDSFGEWEGPGTLQRAIDAGAGWPSVYRKYPISGRLSHLLSRIAMVQFR